MAEQGVSELEEKLEKLRKKKIELENKVVICINKENIVRDRAGIGGAEF